MGGGIAKGTERIQRLDGLLGLVGGIHALRFIDDDDGAGRLHEFDGLPSRQLVALLVDDVAFSLRVRSREVLAEGVDVDDQDLQRIADRELAQAVHLFRVVHEMLEGKVVVKARKCSAVMSMFLSTPSRMATLGTTMMNFWKPYRRDSSNIVRR